METITNACYEACKTNRKTLDGWPDARPLLEELRSLTEGQLANPTEPFKVTAAFPGGALVIRNQFFEQFSEIPEFQSLVDGHNSKYNPEGLSLQIPVAMQEDTPPGASKAEVLLTDEPIKEETVATIPAASPPQFYESLSFCCMFAARPFPPRQILQLNSQSSMILDEQKGCCYVRADLAEPVILASMREVFSFGSGTWCDGP